MLKVIGLDSNLKTLNGFIASGRLNRTFLLLGDSDSGKTFLGKHFAALLLDGRAERNAHPDFSLISCYGSKYADILDQFLNCCFKKPFESERVVVFLDNVDYLPKQASNKLLKTLEEPPAQTTIILSAKSPTAVLDTILSRSIRIPLKQRSFDEKVAILNSLGFKDAEERLQTSSSLKICSSADYPELFKLVQSYRTIFANLEKQEGKDLLNTIDACSKQDFNIEAFLLANINHSDSIVFKNFMNKALYSAKSYMNKYVLVYNISLFLKHGRKTIS